MTDKERARSMLGVINGSVIDDKHTYLLAALAIVRADQTEKCAQEVEALKASVSMMRNSRDAETYNAAVLQAAAAIRAMGDKG